MSRHPFASLLLIDSTPHNRDTCRLTLTLGDIVRILTEGLNADTNLADLPELEKTITASASPSDSRTHYSIRRMIRRNVTDTRKR